jgi:trimeric autotransporter adhesin
MITLRSIPLCVLAGVVFSSLPVLAQQAAPTVRIVSPIDESRRVTLQHTIHPLAIAANDRGAAPDAMQLDRLQLVLQRSPAQESALRQLIAQMHAPGSPSFHQWLTPAQFGAQFGASDQDVSTIETWLGNHGFSVKGANPGKGTIEFSGSVAQLRDTFHTQIHKYVVNGETHYANAENPQIPAALAPVIGGFSSLNNFRVKSYVKKIGETAYNPSTGRAKSQWTIGSGTFDYQAYNFILSPGDFAVQYDLNPLYNQGLNGSGQTIAIINDSNINIDLVSQFRTLFGVSPAGNVPQVIIDGNDPGVDGINNPDGPNFDSSEAYLDVEWSGAVAPSATIDLVIAADTALESGLILAAEHAVYGNIAPVLSLSFGTCEANLGSSNGFINNLWEQAAAQGQTVMVSAGDNGAAGCDDGTDYAIHGQAVNGFGSTPYNISVGGTDFEYSSYSGGDSAINTQLESYWNTSASNNTPTVSLKSYIPEQPWNDSQFGLNLFNEYVLNGDTDTVGGGGGASNDAYCSTGFTATGTCSVALTGYPKPSWQSGTGVPSDSVRDLPDVSLFSANGYNDSYYGICATDGDCQPVSSGSTVQIYGVGGTSASAPSFAGIMALVNQKYGRQGQADTVLYPMAAQFPAAFHDIIVGNNSEPCAYETPTDLTPPVTPDCIQTAANKTANIYYTIDDPTYGTALEGQIGNTTNSTVEYNAVTGYDLASGLGTVDATQLVNNWGNVAFNASGTTFTATPTTITHGQTVTINGSVTSGGSRTPTGNVALMSNSTEPSQQGVGSAVLLNGAASTFALNGSGAYSGSVTTLPGGTYNIWASYGGDGYNASSVSTPVSVTVSPESTGIALDLIAPGPAYYSSSIASSISYGTQLVLSGQVAPTADVAGVQSCLTTTAACPTFTTPTGTIAFADNSATIDTAVINAEGDAEFNAPFAVGSHSITASYSGDNSYKASSTSSTPITFTIGKNTPLIGGDASNQSSSTVYLGAANQPTVVNIVVENSAIANVASSSGIFPVSVAPPTGTLTLSGLPAGVATSVPLTAAVDSSTGAPDGVATVTIPAATTGNYTIGVSYPGDANYNSSTGSITVDFQGLTGGQPSITAATMSGSISPNTEITVSGTVTGVSGHGAPGSPASTNPGFIYVFSSGYEVTQVQVVPGTGVSSTFSFTLNSQTLFQGANFITLQYSGDNTYYPSAVTLNSGSAITNPLSDFSIVPETTIVPVTSTNSGSDTLNLASVNGFSGAVALTCASATSGITCSPTPASVSLASGGMGASSVTISAASSVAAGNYSVLVTGKDPTGEFIHTAAIQAVVTGSSAAFSLANSGNIAIGQGATTGNTSTITATAAGGFSGTVYLSCKIVSAPASPTSPATCTIPASFSLPGTTSGSLTVNTTSTTTTGTYSVLVTGVSGSATSTTSVSVTVNSAAVAGFTLSAAAASPASIAPGASTSSVVTAAPTNGYTGSVSFVCSLTSSPAGAVDVPSCTPPGSPITLPGTTTATISITTTAETSDLSVPKIHDGKGWLGAGSGALLAVLVFFGIPARRRSWRSMLGVLIALVALGAMASCGGVGGGGSGSGGGGSGGGNPGTTAGSYTFTVTGSGTPAVTPAPTATITFTVN